MAIEAVIFDMDGLMVDTEPLARASWDRVVESHGGPLSDAAYLQMLGRPTHASAEIVLVDRDLPWTAEELIERKTAAYLATLDDGVPSMPGLYELLDEIEARGMPWGVATASPRAIAEIVLQKLELTERCSALAGVDDVVHSKPAPDLYLLVAERLGVAPQNCLALEDTETGCRAAAAADMTVLAVPGEMTQQGAFKCADRRYASLVDVAADLPGLLRGPDLSGFLQS